MTATDRVLWCVHDGASGNRRQALALAEGLAIRMDARVLECCVSVRRPWRWLAPHWLPRSADVFGPPFAEKCCGALPLLAVGCGRQAALATRWLRTRRGMRVVQILDPRIDPDFYDLVVVPEHDGLRGDNVLTTQGSLHAIDAMWLAQARIAAAQLGLVPGPRTLLLLGGSTRDMRLDRAYWQGLRERLDAWLDADGGSLWVSSSRRTPPWLRKAARDDLPGRQWHGTQDGDNPYAGMLAWADRIIVTADSANLLSEACATTVPVYCHAPQAQSGKLGHLLTRLQDRGRLRILRHLPEDARFANIEPLRNLEAVLDAVQKRLELPSVALPRSAPRPA
ncbi:MAG: hypothetical protein BWZ07_01072 [Alphaproteobacteria bacterium ADurb.BinA280]|nr:MAG: hypothetical protein BWZ07_01072 [Alphaproteobacteria bacterium ADurb.BinA280]